MSIYLTPDGSVCLQPVSELEARTLEWLWPGRLALGKLAILDGDPGMGKSLLALDLCARLSVGRPLPDGRPGPGAVPSIFLNGEDGAEDTIRSRLEALGADMQKVFVVHRTVHGIRDSLRFPEDTPLLEQAVEKTGARLVVIDPIMAFLQAMVAVASDANMRQALLPLIQLADKHRCAILLHRHLNKSGGVQSIYRGGGSIGINGACRSGWLVARDPHDPVRRVLAEVKNNLAAPQPSLAYTVQAGDQQPATITWLGASPWSANQLLAEAARAQQLPARDRAREFLTRALEAGPRTSRELWALAQQYRVSSRTLRRVKQEMNIRSVRISADGQRLSYWLLPGQELPASVPPEAIPPDLEEWLAPLRQKYRPSTPLDDL
jgi:RecA-family ATPase